MAAAGVEGSAPAAAVCTIGPDLWFRAEPDGTYRIGLTVTAQRRAGKIAHCRPPEPGRHYRAREPAVSLESEKWVGHLPMPVGGTVVEVNRDVASDPGSIDRDPYGEGWLFRLRPDVAGALEALLESVAGAVR